MMPLFIVSLLAPLLVASVAIAKVPENKPCITYWSVGDTPCTGENADDAAAVPTPQAGAAPLPPRQLAVPQPPIPMPGNAGQPSLDRKVDSYLENYGKPPREFVAFNLEPSVENALRWVQKYEEMTSRERAISNAWEQATGIYNRLSAEERAALLGADAEPPVPDLNQQLGIEPEQQAPASSLNDFRRINAVGPGGRLTTAGAGPLEVTYYYTSTCTFCERLERNLQDALASFAGQVALECVDVGGQNPSPPRLPLGCSTRAPLPGELDFLGVSTTPTILVAGGDGGRPATIRGFQTRENLEKNLRLQLEALYQ